MSDPQDKDFLEEEDEALGKAIDWKILKRLMKYVLPYKKSFTASLAILFLLSWVTLIGPYLIKCAVDGPLTSLANRPDRPVDDVMRDLLGIVFLYMGFISMESILRYAQIVVTNLCGQSIIRSLRKQVFAHVHKMSLSFFDRNPVGKLVTRVTSDVESLSEVFVSGAAIIFEDLFKLILIVAVLFYLSPKLAAVTLLALLPLFLVANIFRIRSRAGYREVRGKIARTNAYLQEAISGLRIIQIFGQEKKSAERFAKRNAELRDAHLDTVKVYSTFYPAVEVVSQLGVVVLLWLGSREIAAGRLSFGQFIQFWFYTKHFFEPIRQLAEKYNVLQAAMASSERIFRVLDSPVEIANPAAPVESKKLSGAIEFDQVTFSYRENDPVLKNVSFKVNPGESVAVVGATGAGKTTIINLIPRFYDVTAGRVLVDGVDVRDYRKQTLRAQIGVVLQDVFLFSGTIADNIKLGEDETITDERIEEVSRHVNASRFINKLPKRFETPVMERGLSLSVGERQLLSFARALAFDPRILILDEATSSVDTETEVLIQSALEKLLKGRTSIIVAHRLSTIQRADRILVIHRGEIREEGNHQELIQKGGLYKKLYLLQYEAQERLKSGSK